MNLTLLPPVYEWQKWTHEYEATDEDILAMSEDEYTDYMDCFRRQSRKLFLKTHPAGREERFSEERKNIGSHLRLIRGSETA